MLRSAFSARSSRLGPFARGRQRWQRPNLVLSNGGDSTQKHQSSSSTAHSYGSSPKMKPSSLGWQKPLQLTDSAPHAQGLGHLAASEAFAFTPKIKNENNSLYSLCGPLQQTRTLQLQGGCGLRSPSFFSCNFIAKPSVCQVPRGGPVRWLGSDGKAGSTGAGPMKQESPKTEPTKEEVNAPKESTTKEGSREQPESLDPRAFLLGTTARIRKVADWQVGDEIATYAIVVLLGLILIAPIMGQYMRRSDSDYDELDTDDQVVDLSRIIKRDYFDKISEGASLEDKGVVHSVIADVLSSKSLQEQAIKFVVTIVQSDEVKSACQRLLKDLWNDLIKDPETTAQVIFLLNVAIQNEDIRLAVKKLVLEIVEDEEVLEELVRLLQKLGQDQEVLDATKSLLTESAHNALNDPEVLDHSMEFATDVVGDDVVQRTAGEALRNTLSYAVQPGMSIVLAATGVGLLLFSIVSLGYARSSEQDAKVLDQAVSGLARSLQPNSRLTDRLWNLITLPFRAVSTAAGALFTTVLLPFHLVQHAVARIEYTSNAASKAASLATTWFVGNARATMSWVAKGANSISSLVATYGTVITKFVLAPLSWLSVNFGSSGGSTGKASRNAIQSEGHSSRLGQFWRWVPPEALARVWVALDAVSEVLRLSSGYVVSFVAGKSGASST